MPMKIPGQTSAITYSGTNSVNKLSTAKHNQDIELSTTNKNYADISSYATYLNDLAQIIETLPIVDENRVQEIKEKIDSGNYTVNYNLVAEKLIKDEQAIH
jgi:flagellar biosynthesis anti-sigma factor FlgM